MTKEQFVAKNFHEYFGLIADAWLAKHEQGATFSRDIRTKQEQCRVLLEHMYDQLSPPKPSPAPPGPAANNGVTTSEKGLPRGR